MNYIVCKLVPYVDRYTIIQELNPTLMMTFGGWKIYAHPLMFCFEWREQLGSKWGAYLRSNLLVGTKLLVIHYGSGRV